MWGEEQESSQDRYQFVVTTDKTIYSPGETLHLRVLVMQYSFMNESRMALEEQLVNITYYDPEMNAYFWTTLVTNQYGVLTFDVPFDNDAILGKYSFKFTIGEISYNYGIKLQYYEKPVFRVTIDTNGRDFYPSSDNILEKIFKPANFEGYVIAEYYFGQPVAGANVELILKNYRGDIVSNISGKTDARGRFYFNINLETLGDLRYSFFADAIVIDDYQRKASTESSFTRYNELGAWGYLSKWDPKPGEQLEYFYSVYQYIYNSNSWWWDLNPLSNVSVDINIYGYILSPWYNDIIDTGIKLHNYKGETNEYGSGKLNFSIPIEDVKTYNWFRIQLSVELEDGRSHTSSYYFRYQKYNLDLSIQNDQLQPGDTLQLTASFTDSLTGKDAEGHGRIRIYDTQYQTIRTGSFDFNGQLNFSVPLSEFSPEGTYYISSYVYTPSNSYYRGYEYHSAHVGFHVGNYYSFEWDCNLTKTSQYSSIYNVEMGKIIHFFGTTNVSSNMNGSFEIYKRGLVSSTSLDLSSGTISLNLTVSAKLGPSFMVMISLLSSSGRLFQQNLMFHVQYPTEVQLSTDKEVYEPGDTLTLTITPKSELPTLLSLSFIDSSVLAVEPEDDSEMAYFTQNSYYPWIFSASSWGSDWNIYRYWWYCYDGPRYLYFGYDYGVNNWRGFKDMYLTYDLQENSDGGVNDAMSYGDIVRKFQTEIRKNISESANWIPQQIITEPTNITFKLPDNIGEWTIRAVTNGMDINSKQILWGNIQTIQIKSYLPFFVEFDIPNPLNQDDIMDLKGYIYNYLGEDIEATVAIEAPGLNVLNNPVQTVNIPHNFVSEIEFSIYLSEPFEHNISVVAATNVSGIGYSDAKQMTAYIHPHGIEISKRTVGYLNSSDSSTALNFTIEPGAVYHKESLSLYTNLMDISLDSWDQLIGYPYGCVEQTISKLRSTALVYNYLNQTGQLTPDLQKSLDAMIQTGLARIYNFQFLNGGWGWWHGDEEDSQIQMSTIVLSALLQIQNFGFTVKLDVISDGIDYILSKQTTSGSWQFPYYSASEIESTIFVLNTLLQSPNATLLYLTELNKGFNRVDSLWQENTQKNSYTAALWYLTIHNTIFSDATLEAELITFLKINMHTTQGMAYWDRPDDDNWYWRNLGNQVAITAYALMALAEDDFIDNLMLIQNGVQFMLSQRNRYGWWCTADTSAAIISLTKLAQYSMYAGFINFNGTANIDVSPIYDGNNSNNPENFDISLDLSDNTYNPAQLKVDLTNFVDIGENALNISVNGTGQLVYVFTSIQVLRGSPNFTAPTNISVQSGDIFEIPISISNLENHLLFQNVSIEIKNVLPEFQLINESYSRYIENWSPDNLIVFQFNASQSGGIYSIGPISISGTLFYNQDENDSSIISNDGELGIAVDLASIPITVENTLPYAAGEYLSASYFYNINTGSSENPISADSQSQFLSKVSFDKLTLTKEYNSPEFLFPGKIIPITLTVENTGLLKEYYTLTDSIPTGMEV
ncbi:MAG: MG2 domain-containing protein, partial [Promethearchaeota archaeon]